MPIITSANVATAIVKLVSAQFLPQLRPQLVVGGLVNRNFEPQLANGGDTVNIPIQPTLTANNLLSGGTVSNQNPAPGNAQLVINRHAEATFTIPDMVAALSTPSTLALYMQPAVNALCVDIESTLMGLYTGFTLTPLGTGGNPIGEATLDSAETLLFKNNAPAGKRVAVVDPDNYATLRQNPRFSEFQSIGSAGAISEGNLGKLKDFVIARSNLVKQTGSAPVTNHGMAFHADAIGLAFRRLGKPLPGTGAIAEYIEDPETGFGLRVVMSYKPDQLAQQFTVDALYGAAVLRPTNGVVIRG